MDIASRLKMIRALDDFNKAYQKLNSLWIEETDTDLNELDAIRYYPFDKSFDELGVGTWCNESVNALFSCMDDEVLILNPKCATCSMCQKYYEDLFQCMAGVDSKDACAELLIPYDRQLVIDFLVDTESATAVDTAKDLIRKGCVGLESLTDLELYYRYKKHIGG